MNPCTVNLFEHLLCARHSVRKKTCIRHSCSNYRGDTDNFSIADLRTEVTPLDPKLSGEEVLTESLKRCAYSYQGNKLVTKSKD